MNEEVVIAVALLVVDSNCLYGWIDRFMERWFVQTSSENSTEWLRFETHYPTPSESNAEDGYSRPRFQPKLGRLNPRLIALGFFNFYTNSECTA